MDSKREELIGEVINIELDMFKKVNSTLTSPCQEYLKTFKVMRWMTHSVSPVEILESYLNDLQQGVKDGRNFMREKYAKMEGQIPLGKNNPLLDEIVEIETKWMGEVVRKYPNTFKPKGDGFKSYIACALGSLSESTIKKLYDFTIEAKKDNINLVEERYKNLFAKVGKVLT